MLTVCVCASEVTVLVFFRDHLISYGIFSYTIGESIKFLQGVDIFFLCIPSLPLLDAINIGMPCLSGNGP